jgi:DNA-binding CsgD family transcriptional regulator
MGKHHLIGPAGKLEAMTERQWKCFQLRASGYSFRKIGAELNISFETARQDCKHVVGQLQADTQETASTYRTLELQRVGELLQKYLPAALAGDLKASEHVLRLSQFEADLTGSRAPVAVAVEETVKPAAGQVDLSRLSVTELYELRALTLKSLGQDGPLIEIEPVADPKERQQLVR